MKLDKIYCINLEICNERRKLMMDQFLKMKISNIADMISAKDVEDAKDAIRLNLLSPEKKLIKNLPQIAISLSHYECFRKILISDNDIACIMEDDIIMDKNMMAKLKHLLNENIENMVKTEPVVIWLTGLKSIRNCDKNILNNPPSIINIGPQYGNCMYIINKKFIRILISSYFPLSYPCDDYMKLIIRKNKIESRAAEKNNKSSFAKIQCLSILPVLGYDLSSEYYKEYWTEKDKTTRNRFNRLSTTGMSLNKYIGSNEYSERKINLSIDPLIDVPESMINKINLNFDKNRLHFRVGNFSKISESSIVNFGYFDGKTAVSKFPFIVNSVRGPITRSILLKKGVMCSEIYCDFYLLTSLLYPIKNSNENLKEDTKEENMEDKIKEKYETENENKSKIVEKEEKSTINEVKIEIEKKVKKEAEKEIEREVEKEIENEIENEIEKKVEMKRKICVTNKKYFDKIKKHKNFKGSVCHFEIETFYNTNHLSKALEKVEWMITDNINLAIICHSYFINVAIIETDKTSHFEVNDYYMSLDIPSVKKDGKINILKHENFEEKCFDFPQPSKEKIINLQKVGAEFVKIIDSFYFEKE